MMAFIGVGSFLAFPVFVVLFIVALIRGTPKKKFGIGILVCFLLFVVAAVADPVEKDDGQDVSQRTIVSEQSPDPESLKPTATPKPTNTPTPTASPAPTPTPEPTLSPTPAPTPAPTPDPTPEPTPSPEPTPQPERPSSGNGGNGSNFDTYDNPEQQQTDAARVLNTNTMKIHYPSCSEVKKIAPQNYSTSNLTESELIAQGYTTCGRCH